jgi:hypothetical protein
VASKQQRADAAAALGYRNMAHRGYHFNDLDRGKALLKRVPKPMKDPPAIVECSTCNERVLAKQKGYWDASDAVEVAIDGPILSKHRHQPVGWRAYGKL